MGQQGLGTAWHGRAWPGEARHGEAWQQRLGGAWRGVARRGLAWRFPSNGDDGITADRPPEGK